MTSLIYTGQLSHTRFKPVQHRFQYPSYAVSISLNKLESQQLTTFGYNKHRLFSIWDKDFLHRNTNSLREKVNKVLEQHDIDIANIDDTVLLTVPRYMGYVFNPLSLFYCYSGTEVKAVIAQVNNTFKEMHLYCLTDPKFDEETGLYSFETEKTFHVSPFFPVNGRYSFKLSDIRKSKKVIINYMDEGEKNLNATWLGKKKEITNISILSTIIKYPLTAAITMPRIIIQAYKLYYLKKVNFYKKPITGDNMTIRKKKPSFLQKRYKQLVCKLFNKITQGHLEMTLPEGEKIHFGNKSEQPIKLDVLDYRFFNKLVFGQDIGLGEAYIEGFWKTDNLNDVLDLFLANMNTLSSSFLGLSKLNQLRNKKYHKTRENNKKNSSKNISYHYDVSNSFYSLFLDSTLTYSSALFTNKEQSLKEAQIAKMDELIRKADIRPEHRVLEIGTGWAGLATHLKKKIGCKVTTITISKEQYRYATEKFRNENLHFDISLQFKDYRDMNGKFDRIISVEMIEAVGYKYLPSYFQACNRLLNNNGKLVLQAITIPHERYKNYSKNCDFIQKHIFPGGHLPSIEHIHEIISQDTQLKLCSLDEIGLHYAETLRQWRENMLSKSKTIKSLGFNDAFLNKYEYYFSYCEVGFLKRFIHNHHLVFDKVTTSNRHNIPTVNEIPLYSRQN